MMLERHPSSPFLDPASVDAWDAWFRLREGGELRDLSIESTWQRVADAMTCTDQACEGPGTEPCFNALARWQLLFDERILATAGSARVLWPDDAVAVLNLAGFVQAPFSAQARVDFPALRDAAGLAVRCLDCTSWRLPGATCAPRIGVIGLADALALLGLRYDSQSGRDAAGNMAQAVAEGCLAANVRQARDHGRRLDCNRALRARLVSRGMPGELIRDAEHGGLRHGDLSVITSQRRLALFANNVSDALDPLCPGAPVRPMVRGATTAAGYAANVARLAPGHSDAATRATIAYEEVTVSDQIRMRGAVQPWIDAPIDYPIRVRRTPDPHSEASWRELARASSLGTLRWEIEPDRCSRGAG